MPPSARSDKGPRKANEAVKRVAEKATAVTKSKAAPKPGPAKVDVVFQGPMLFVPEQQDGIVTGLEVFSPRNAHPVGALFLPGVWFTAAELENPPSGRWPEVESFSLLDPHSYALHLTQAPAGKKGPDPFAIHQIPAHNHKVRPGRRLSGEWDVAIAVHGRVSGWGSHRLIQITDGLLKGSDAPMVAQAASLHRLTFEGVTGAEFSGVGTTAKEYLRANVHQGGTLIVTGEIPYQPTLQHERQAIDALARLAGLDLMWMATEATPHVSRVMHHTTFCGFSIIVA